MERNYADLQAQIRRLEVDHQARSYRMETVTTSTEAKLAKLDEAILLLLQKSPSSSTSNIAL